jgi:hypothetical protein
LIFDYLVNREVEFISFPIGDRSVHEDNQRILDFCLELCDRIKRGEVVLVHCWSESIFIQKIRSNNELFVIGVVMVEQE